MVVADEPQIGKRHSDIILQVGAVAKQPWAAVAKVSKSVACWSQTDRMVRTNRQNTVHSCERGEVSLSKNLKMSEFFISLAPLFQRRKL